MSITPAAATMGPTSEAITASSPVRRGFHVLSAPIVELISVTIEPDVVNNDLPWQIYGEVEVVDTSGGYFDAFRRERDDPECFDRGETNLELTLSNTEYLFWEPFPKSKIIINLEDKVRSDIIAQCDIDLDFTDKPLFEEGVHDFLVHGSFGKVRLSYKVVPCAVIAAELEFMIGKSSDLSSEEDISINAGVISASCVGNIVEDNQSKPVTYNTTLFSVTCPNKHVATKCNTPLTLKRAAVVVPAHSSTICIRSTIFSDICKEYRTRYLGGIIEKVDLGNGFYLQITLGWCAPYPKGDPLFRKFKALSIERHLWRTTLLEESLMEVFSVFVFEYPNEDATLLSGTVSVKGRFIRDRPNSSYIFNTGDDSIKLTCPHKGEALKLKGPSIGIMGNVMGLFVDLKCDNDLEFCEGHISWSEHTIDDRYNKRLCSVIQGKRGYVAVLYSIFSLGLFASVNVILNLKRFCQEVDVTGEIVARYSGHEYSCRFERECYQSCLFRGCVNLESKNEISVLGLPLSKSLVAVPSVSPLIIDVDLEVTISLGGEFDVHKHRVCPLKGVKEFEVGLNSSQGIKTADCDIDVCIEWGDKDSFLNC